MNTKWDTMKEKIKGFCQKVGKRNFVIFGAVLLIAAAVTINLVIFSQEDGEGFDYNQPTGTEEENTTQIGQEPENAGDSYFASVQVSRQRSRDEAIEVLQSVVDNASSTEAARNEALAEINKLATVMATEANIETLILAKGFEECVAVISDSGARIVVRSDGLTAAQISQINEIVYTEAGIKPASVTIIER